MITELPKKIENPDFSQVLKTAEELLSGMMLLRMSSEEELNGLTNILASEVLEAMYGEDISKIIASNIADKIKEIIGG
jgi:hypothetical protein